MPMQGAPEPRHFVSDTLGLPGFPVGTEPSSDTGDHVMGVVVFAWLTEHPLERWGPDWARSGSLTARFRQHLRAGVHLTTELVGHADSMDLRVINPSATEVYATAHAHKPDPGRRPVTAGPPARPWPTNKAQPRRDDLTDRVFAPLTFEFDAARDLRFTERLSDGALWRRHGCAHPAWLASATNAIVRRNIDFAAPGTWTNAGLTVHQHEPIGDGSTITVTGGIRELFDRGRNRFAVAALTAWVDDVAVASLDNTFVYDVRGSC
jgi:hypothetical protein